MKVFFSLLAFIMNMSLHAQNNIVGVYKDYFGNQIKFNDDSTFNHTWHFDLASSWTNGTWRVDHDTIFLTMVPIYDTLKIGDINKGKIKDSLVLSQDAKADVIDDQIAALLSSGGQHRQNYPDKLFYEKEKLFRITPDGKIFRENQKGNWSDNMYPSWYIRKETL
jgi:hypothetical protein